jgi:hypothetical protein
MLSYGWFQCFATLAVLAHVDRVGWSERMRHRQQLYSPMACTLYGSVSPARLRKLCCDAARCTHCIKHAWECRSMYLVMLPKARSDILFCPAQSTGNIYRRRRYSAGKLQAIEMRLADRGREEHLSQASRRAWTTMQSKEACGEFAPYRFGS